MLRGVFKKNNMKKQKEESMVLRRISELSHPVLRMDANMPCGTPGGCDEPYREYVSLVDALGLNRDNTFISNVVGESMIGIGLMPGDDVIINGDRQPMQYDTVAAWVDGGNTIKRFYRDDDGKVYLIPANPDFQVIDAWMYDDFRIIGVVERSIHNLRDDRPLEIRKLCDAHKAIKCLTGPHLDEKAHNNELLDALTGFFNGRDARANAMRFLAEIDGKKNTQVVTKVNQLVKSGKISSENSHSPLWKLLHTAGLYTCTLSNWNHYIEN